MNTKRFSFIWSVCLPVLLFALLWITVVPVLAASVTVTTTVDESDGSCGDGDCSLRDAVATAAANDVIEIPAGTYALTLGQITLNKNLTLMGTGGSPQIGLGTSRIFEVNTGATVTLTGLVLTGTNSTDNGAGLYLVGGGTAVLNNVTIANNTSTQDGGGIYVSGGTVNIVSANISGNTADQGGGIYLRSGSVTMQDGVIAANHTTMATAPGYSGGGVYVDLAGASFTMNGGTIMSNTVSVPNDTFPGGGVLVRSGTAVLNGGEIRGHTAFRGGGVLNNGGHVTINGTDILSNTSAYGAGVYAVQGTAYITHTAGSIAYNTADPIGFNGNNIMDFGGGGVYVFLGTFTSTGGDISYNHSTWNGGGIHVASGTANVIQTAFTGNTADNNGGAVHVRGAAGVLGLTNSTLTGNGPTAVSMADGTVTARGNTLDQHTTAFNSAGGTLTAYANNITNYTTGVSGAGTVNGRHNWWGSGAAAGTVGSTDAFTYRLGAAVVSWGEGSLADGAAVTGGTGTGVIVNHGTAVPFGLPATPVGTACSSYYDFFTAPGASGTWTVSVPVNSDAGCDTTFADARLFHFALNGSNAPDTTCTPDAACWQRYNTVTAVPGSPRLLQVALTTAELGGTPIVTGNTSGNDPTAVSLQTFGVHGNAAGVRLLMGVAGLLGLASLALWRVTHQPVARLARVEQLVEKRL